MVGTLVCGETEVFDIQFGWESVHSDHRLRHIRTCRNGPFRKCQLFSFITVRGQF